MKKLFQVGFGILAFLFFFLAWGNRDSLLMNDGLACIQLVGSFPEVSEVREVMKAEETLEEGVDCLFWGNLGRCQLTNPSLSRTAQAICVGLYGDGNLYDSRVHTLSREDSSGCVLDEETARELFGSTQAVGLEVSLNGQLYTVRQVIKTDKGEALFSAGTGMQMNWVNVKGSDSQTAQDDAEAFLLRYGYQGKAVSGKFLSGIYKGILLCLGLFYLVWLARTLCFRFLREKGGLGRKWQQAGFVTVCLVGSGILLWCLQPDTAWIPANWSDFSYWGDLFREQQENLYFFLQTEKPFWEMERLWRFAENILFCAASLLCAAAGRIH